jgi:hypothetical protein
MDDLFSSFLIHLSSHRGVSSTQSIIGGRAGGSAADLTSQMSMREMLRLEVVVPWFPDTESLLSDLKMFQTSKFTTFSVSVDFSVSCLVNLVKLVLLQFKRTEPSIGMISS